MEKSPALLASLQAWEQATDALEEAVRESENLALDIRDMDAASEHIVKQREQLIARLAVARETAQEKDTHLLAQYGATTLLAESNGFKDAQDASDTYAR